MDFLLMDNFWKCLVFSSSDFTAENHTFIWIICLDMANVMSWQFVDGLFDVSQSIFFPHGQSRKVGMCASSIPVTLKKVYFFKKTARFKVLELEKVWNSPSVDEDLKATKYKKCEFHMVSNPKIIKIYHKLFTKSFFI